MSERKRCSLSLRRLRGTIYCLECGLTLPSAALSSPTTSTHPQPPTASIPKLKLKLRATPTPTSTPPPSIPSPARKAKDKAPKVEAWGSRQSSPAVGTRTRKSHADQRPPASSGSAPGTEDNPHVVGLSIDDSDSDLTPEDEDSPGDVAGGCGP